MSCAVILSLLLLASSLAPTYAAPSKARKPRRELIVETGPSEEDFEDAGLAGQVVSYTNLVEKGREYYHETHIKHSNGMVLGYVTPWNPQGYEFASRFNAKFTHISPVWYQLKKGDQGITLQGGHEVNHTWITELRTPSIAGASVPKVVPRVMFELDPQDMVQMMESPKHVVEMLGQEVRKQGFDGLVLEVWVQWVAMNGLNNPHFKGMAYHFVRSLASWLHADTPRKELIIVVPPVMPSHHRAPFFEPIHFRDLQADVDGFSVMTYDYSSAAKPGPNSPTHWMRVNFDLMKKAGPESAGKVLMGTNFYGYRYLTNKQASPTAITAADFLAMLNKYAPTLIWDEMHEEHHFSYQEGRKQFQVFYPTPASLAARLHLVRELGAGLSIWELGQGLERFMDVL